ncbi:MAG: 2-amino-4-hydroxy-6-hydroxymethyldihydropteridine diphosphokinase [Clostridiales bacterium]|nr:2-amino-4-hydroxy-6-hydroxymethyldihydropteridine diphosphokinase [Clostridiales bacterium]
MTGCYLSLGSNVGDRIGNLSRAVSLLHRPKEGVRVISVSPVFETSPVGYKDQQDFLNICVRIETSLEPLALLSLCQRVEETLLRVRTIRWGPRTIDVDILTYGDITMNTQRLTIPHPRMHDRGFVQVPLMFLNGESEIPEKWRGDVRYFGELPWEAHGESSDPSIVE